VGIQTDAASMNDQITIYDAVTYAETKMDVATASSACCKSQLCKAEQLVRPASQLIQMTCVLGKRDSDKRATAHQLSCIVHSSAC
jgi:hypothetical protein